MLTLSHLRFSGAHRAPSLLARIRRARAVAQERRTLAQLDDALLKDIGLTSFEAQKEAQRPAWDAPSRWTC